MKLLCISLREFERVEVAVLALSAKEIFMNTFLLFCRFHHSSPLHKPLGCFSAMMVEEETMGGVERSNLLHVLSIKFEVEEIQILFHSLLANGLRDDDYVALQQPAQGYLCGSLAVFLANLAEGRVGEQSVLFFIILKSYRCYFILLYSSSLTASCHSLDVFSPGISKARWANQLSFAAPCQCFTLAGIWMTVPGRISCAGLPSS